MEEAPRSFNSWALICLAQGSGRGPALAEGKSLAAAQPASIRKLPRCAMRMRRGARSHLRGQVIAKAGGPGSLAALEASGGAQRGKQNP